MISERKILTIEYAAIILLWSLVVISPLLFMDDYNPNWRAAYVMWTESAVVGFVFLMNRLVLMPRLFFARKYVKYAFALVGLFIFLAIFVLHFDGVNLILSLFGESTFDHAMSPMMHDMPMHDMPMQRPPRGVGMHDMLPANKIIPPMITVLILSGIVIALDMGLSIAAKWIISEQKQAEINRERVTAQLSNLQSQVSPHFFMNTLNNIHALVDINSERAKQTIIELSSLMDYLLYDSSCHDRVSLQRELTFLGSYVNLMRLRFSKQLKVSFTYGDNVPTVKIPPLLFLNFIENAFKYGVDIEQESYIKIKFSFGRDYIMMTTINTNHSHIMRGERHGLGIKNARKRLDLIYGDRYTLDISNIDKIFHVTLKIPLL